jgi:hypothetical protein
MRKRNDATGHLRGAGHYSDGNNVKFDRRDHFLNKVGGIDVLGQSKTKDVSGETATNGNRKAGFQAPLDKK